MDADKLDNYIAPATRVTYCITLGMGMDRSTVKFLVSYSKF